MPAAARKANDPAAVPAVSEVPAVVETVPAAEHAPAHALEPGKRLGKRGLATVSWLAMILCDLGYVTQMVKWETEAEGDGSTIAEDLAASIKSLGETLLAMTAEEVAELLAEISPAEEPDASTDVTVSPEGGNDGELVVYASAFEEKRALFAQLRELPLKHFFGLASVILELKRGRKVIFQSSKTGEPTFERAGKSLSSRNEKLLREGHDMVSQGCDKIRGVLDSAAKDDTTEEHAVDEAAAAKREVRKRRAKALKHKATIV